MMSLVGDLAGVNSVTSRQTDGWLDTRFKPTSLSCKCEAKGSKLDTAAHEPLIDNTVVNIIPGRCWPLKGLSKAIGPFVRLYRAL